MQQLVDLRPAQLVPDLQVGDDQDLSGDGSVDHPIVRVHLVLCRQLVDHDLDQQLVVPARPASQLEAVRRGDGGADPRVDTHSSPHPRVVIGEVDSGLLQLCFAVVFHLLGAGEVVATKNLPNDVHFSETEFHLRKWKSSRTSEMIRDSFWNVEMIVNKSDPSIHQRPDSRTSSTGHNSRIQKLSRSELSSSDSWCCCGM